MSEARLYRIDAGSDRVSAISSKSYVHRLMIAAALSGGKTSIVTNILSSDMKATIGAINALGGNVRCDQMADGTYEITVDKPIGSDISYPCTIDCIESGSTARFILPLASFFAKEAVITGSGRLPERPMGPLCDVLRTAGACVSSDYLPITVSGKPSAMDMSIPGNVSSQYITGLLFMMSQFEKKCRLTVTGSFESAAYVDMTVDVLKLFRADIEKAGNTYTAGGSTMTAPGRIVAEGDWSNAAYIMAIGSLGSGSAFDSLTIEGLKCDSIQGDRAIVDILKKFGIVCDNISNDFTVKGNPVKGVDVDCAQIPDLVPALCVIAAYAPDKSIFRNVGRLRVKECDRIDATSKMLSAVGVRTEVIHDCDREDLVVFGKGMDKKAGSDIRINSFNDHRIAMAASALCFAENRQVLIEDAMAVNKSYPGFYDVLKSIGADYVI